MISNNLKKKAVLFASIFSLSCFIYLNLFVRSEIETSNFEAEIEQAEDLNSPKIMAPDLKVVSRFMEISKKVLKSIH